MIRTAATLAAAAVALIVAGWLATLWHLLRGDWWH